MPRWLLALRRVRAAGPVLGRLVLGGALRGVVVYLGLFGLCLAVHRAAEYMGVEDKTVTDAVIKLFEAVLIAQQLRLLSIYALIGTLAGGEASNAGAVGEVVAKRGYDVGFVSGCSALRLSGECATRST